MFWGLNPQLLGEMVAVKYLNKDYGTSTRPKKTTFCQVFHQKGKRQKNRKLLLKATSLVFGKEIGINHRTLHLVFHSVRPTTLEAK